MKRNTRYGKKRPGGCVNGITVLSGAILLLAGCVSDKASHPQVTADPVASAVARVVAKCPEKYPETVTPLPSDETMAGMSTTELMELGKSWNPALRLQVAKGLAARGISIMPLLVKAGRSNHWQQREVAGETLARMIKQDKRDWREAFPDITDKKEVTDRVRVKYAAATPFLVRLASDPRTEVRGAALDGFAWLQPQTKEAAEAVLRLCNDPDVYVANQAMMVFGRDINRGSLGESETVERLTKAMTEPLPRGKGDIVRAIMQMPEDIQRDFIPVLLAHLDWKAKRDTMFAAAGQPEALELLTKLNVKEVIPRLPALMKKSFHGSDLFEPAMQSIMAFGKDAKVILPELKAYQVELKEQLTQALPRNQKKTINAKLEKLEKVVKHVESL